MLDNHQIIISIDKRLAAARQEIASLEAALTAMRTPAKTNGRAGRTTRPARADRAAPAKATRATPAKTDGVAPAQAATPANTNARARKARRPRSARRAAVVPAGKLVSLLGGDGLSTTELADRTGGDRQQLLTLLRELEAAGQVRRSGERRNTRWHAITDEDRIAARVAELERQRSRRSQAG